MKAFLLVLVLLLGTGVAFGQRSTRGIAFDSSFVNTLNLGVFHEPGVSYNKFFFEAWVVVKGDGYIWSSGYGGYHVLLFGTHVCSKGRSYLTGNVAYYDPLVSPQPNPPSSPPPLVTDFGSAQSFPCNELIHLAAGYDGNYISTWINGTFAGRTPYNKPRRTIYNYESVGYVGGSNHSGFNGIIFQTRYFENNFPLASTTQNFNPETEFRNTTLTHNNELINANLLLNFEQGNLADQSDGLNGKKHNAVQHCYQFGDVGLFGSYPSVPKSRCMVSWVTWLFQS